MKDPCSHPDDLTFSFNLESHFTAYWCSKCGALGSTDLILKDVIHWTPCMQENIATMEVTGEL